MKLANRFSRLERNEIELEVLAREDEAAECRRVEHLIREAETLSSLRLPSTVQPPSSRTKSRADHESRVN